MSARRRRASIVAALVAVPSLVLASPAAAAVGDKTVGKAGDTDRAQSAAGKKSGDQSRKDGRKDGRKGKGGKSTSATAAEGVVEPGKQVGGKVVKQGWWARANEPIPETGLLAPPTVPAPAAPKGTLPVAQVADRPERIAAIEIALDGKPDGIVDSVVVAFKESADPMANPNSAEGTVFACPVTEFWIGAENGPWPTKPAYDCSAGSVQGVRDDKGVWTFDLTSLAFDWLSSSALTPPAVIFVSSQAEEGATPAPAPPAGPPSNFQVAFDAAQGMGLLAKTSPPAKNNGGGGGGNDDGGDDTSPDPGGGADSGGGGTSGSVPSGGGILDVAAGGGDVALDTGAAPDPGATTTGTSGEAGLDETQTAAPVVAPVALPWHADLGKRGFLLLAVALLLAYACMVALGPTGQPVADQGRRGVSRALERLRAAGSGFGQGKGRS